MKNSLKWSDDWWITFTPSAIATMTMLLIHLLHNRLSAKLGSLTVNARRDEFGNKYDIPPLKDLAKSRFEADL